MITLKRSLIAQSQKLVTVYTRPQDNRADSSQIQLEAHVATSSPIDGTYLLAKSPGMTRESPLKEFTLGTLVEPSDSGGNYNEVMDFRRKITKLEMEFAEKTAAYNEETSRLYSQVTKLRTSVEKGEVFRQKLEYELTLAQKTNNQEKRKFNEKEHLFQKSNNVLEDKIVQLNKKIEKLEQEASDERNERKDEVAKWKNIIDEREREITQLKMSNDWLLEERKRLESFSRDQESENKELIEKCNSLEAQRNSQSDSVRRLMNDLEYTSQNEERLKQELENCREKIRSQEENIEAERAAHLETKFNAEILQLRVRDLEGALEVEKASHMAYKKNLEKVTNDLRDLETVFEEQRDAHSNLKDLMDQKDTQSSTEISELTKELKEKHEQIANLVEQLNIHQNNFESLKTELCEAKKRQSHLEEVYGTNMKELELLLDSFRLEDSSKEQDKSKETKRENSKQTSPTIVLQNLRYTLRDYKTRLKNASMELERMKETMEKLSSECGTYKEITWTRDKVLEEAQRLVKNSHKDVAKYKSECTKYEQSLLQYKTDISNIQRRLDQERQISQHASLETEQLKASLEKETENKARTADSSDNEFVAHRLFLHSVYQQLITGHVFIHSPRDKSVVSFSASELSNMITEQLHVLINDSKLAREKVSQVEETLKNREDAYEKLKKAHDETVSKTSRNVKESEKTWKKQKAELEKHYNRIMEDLQSRSEKTQSSADEAWNKIKYLTKLREEAEYQNSKLRNGLFQIQHEKSCLLAACALLSGGLWPAYYRLNAFSIERRVLSNLIRSLNILKHDSLQLIDLLGSDTHESSVEHGPKLSENLTNIRKTLPFILRFRIAVVAILAVNRLNQLGMSSCKFFIAEDLPWEIQACTCVCSGGFQRSKRIFRGIGGRKGQYQKSPLSLGVMSGPPWLSSPKVVNMVSSSMGELVENLTKLAKKRRPDSDIESEGSSYESNLLGNGASELSNASTVAVTARRAFSKLMNGFNRELSSVSHFEESSDSARYGSDLKSTLAYHLGLGLQRLLSENKHTWKGHGYVASLQIVNSLHHHVLGFTQRLHSAELERRSLRQDVFNLKQEREELKKVVEAQKYTTERVQEDEIVLHERIRSLDEELTNMVPVEKFQNVCYELSAALKREEEAQGLLEEQTTQMEEMGKRMELHAHQGEAKEATIAETLKSLVTSKTELRKKEQNVRQLSKQVAQADMEKKKIAHKLQDAETSLKTFSREREVLVSYLRSVRTALDQSKQQSRLSWSNTTDLDFVIPELVLPDERLAMDGISIAPETKLCQDTLETFLQAQQEALSQISTLNSEKHQLLGKIKSLEKEVESHRIHINKLKEELMAACRRETNEREFVSDIDGILGNIPERDLGMRTDGLRSPTNGFVPLLTAGKKFVEFFLRGLRLEDFQYDRGLSRIHSHHLTGNHPKNCQGVVK